MISDLTKEVSRLTLAVFDREAALINKVSELERENARLQMELDASCNAEELRQYRHANQFLITNQGAYERENARLREALRAVGDLCTTDHESKERFIARVLLCLPNV